jgi:ketosteroid isomerase-like protein
MSIEENIQVVKNFFAAVRNGKVKTIREYIDTQALARASEMNASCRF